MPETLFSSLEMATFLEELASAPSDSERRIIFDRRFASLEPGSVRRFDFIHKLALAVQLNSVQIADARSVALAIACNADKFGDGFC